MIIYECVDAGAWEREAEVIVTNYCVIERFDKAPFLGP